MRLRGVLVAIATMALAAGLAPSPASAANPVKKLCGPTGPARGAAGLASGATRKTCTAANNGTGAMKPEKNLVGSPLSGAANRLLSTGVGAAATSAIAPNELERLVLRCLDQPGQRGGSSDAVPVAHERDPRELTRILDHGVRRSHVAADDPFEAF